MLATTLPEADDQ